MFRSVIGAAAALSVPLIPAPARGSMPCATYEWSPGEGNGASRSASLTVRVFAFSLAEAEAELSRLTAQLVTDGDCGVLADGEILVRVSGGGTCAHLRAAGLYCMTARYTVTG